MKLLAALVTALTLVGFGSAAFACDYMKRSSDSAHTDERIISPTETTS